MSPRTGKTRRVKRTDRIPASLVLSLFFLSGTCGLMYEIVWGRLLVLVVGGSTYATSIVLASFMAGLALGSYAFGRIADRISSPLRLYGMLQIAIGFYGLLLPFIIGLTETWYVALARNVSSGAGLNLVRIVLAFGVLLVPSILMGATFPAISRHLARRLSTFGRVIGRLYSVNTWGGVVGSFLAGMYLLGRAGMRGTLYMAAGVSLAVGVFSVVVGHGSHRAGSAFGATRSPSEKKKIETTETSRLLPRMAILLLGVSGFTSLAYEVLWTRLLVFVIGNSTWSFTVVLTTFLAGLALGSLIVSRFLDRLKRPLLALALIELAIGTVALLMIPVFGRLGSIPVLFPGLAQRILLFQFTVCSLVVLLPATLMGTVFPFALKLFVRRADAIGSGAGKGYGINTFSSIVGALAGGFLLIPLLGLRNGIASVASLNVIASILLFASVRDVRFSFRLVSGSASLAIFALLALVTPRAIFMGGPIARTMERIYYDDGIGGTVEVYQTKKEKIKNLTINGIPEVPTDRLSMQAFRMLGNLPLLLQEDPKRVLIVTFGGGIVAGTVGEHDLERIDCVEICPGVVRAAAFFSEENRDVLSNPRVKIHIDDGRNFLLTSAGGYDVITADATHPSGADSWVLYTQENYRLMRAKLTENGVLVQWLPLHGLTNRDFRIILKTFSSVFPNTSVWFVGANPDFGHAIVVGFKSNEPVPVGRVEERLGLPNVRKDMEPYGMVNVYSVFSKVLLDRDGVSDYTEDVPVNTDDLPWIAFTPRVLYEHNLNALNLSSMLSASGPPTMFDLDAAQEDSLARYIEARRYMIGGVLAICARDPVAAYDGLRTALSINPAESDAAFLLERYQLEDGAPAYNRLREQGIMLVKRGMYSEAAAVFARAAQIRGTAEIYNDLGLAHMRGGKYAQARDALATALAVDPGMEAARKNMELLDRLEME